MTTQRLDKWLWFARLVKTRSQASRLIEAGKVRVNRTRTVKPAAAAKVGDVITAVINRNARIVKILQTGNRRGPASEAQTLYEDLSPPNTTTKKSEDPAPAPAPPRRERGTGRPTKRERRRMDRFRDRTEGRGTEPNYSE